MRSRALKLTLAIAITGLLVLMLFTYVQRSTLTTYDNHLPFIALGEQLKNRATLAKSAYAEVRAGRTSVRLDTDVLKPLISCRTILQGVYDGKSTEGGTFTAITDEDTRIIIKTALVDLDKIILPLQERGKNISADGADEAEFQLAISHFLTTIDEFITHIRGTIDEDQSYFSTLSWISLILVAVAVGVLSIILYRLQSSSERLAEENRKRLQQQEKSVASLSAFIEAISAGNYQVELSMEGDESLRGTLITMRDKLLKNAEDDRKRNWATSGLAQIGEILRANTKTTEELYDNIIRFVVKYTKSSQGGLFLLNGENEADKFLELVACYAFERKKYLKKTITPGDGLVGQCFLEGERIYLLEVPQEYISITSGLGGANPNALLIVPLKVNGQIFGVLELASFGRYEPYQIELVEKFCESIASTISTVRVNDSTRLLLERTQQQAEEMRAQEEEMRQNMEELEATQEEMRRKEKHIQNLLESEKERNEFNKRGRNVIMELSRDHNVLTGNLSDALQSLTRSISKHLQVSRCSIWTLDNENSRLVCEKLYNLQTNSFEEGEELSGKDFPAYFRAVRSEDVLTVRDASTHPTTKEFVEGYLEPLNIRSVMNIPFFNEGKLAGIIVCENQYEQKEWTDDHVEFVKSGADLVTVTFNTSKINRMLQQVRQAEQTMQTIIDNLPRAVFWKDKDLRIQGCNRIFANVAGLSSPKELIGKSDFDMPWREHAPAYRADDMEVMNGRKARLNQEERNVNSEGKESWVLTSKVPVINEQGEVVAVLGMFEDITERKLKEAAMEAKVKELEELKAMLQGRK